MIIGCALVVDELNKGPRLVVRYPESIPSTILNVNTSLLKYHNDYLSITPENFAKLFRPKANLCNKVLELSIDDLHYTSFACSCANTVNSVESATNNSTTSTVVGSSSTVTLFNIVIARVHDNAMKKSLLLPIPSSATTLFSMPSSSSSTQDQVASIMGLGTQIKTISIADIRM